MNIIDVKKQDFLKIQTEFLNNNKTSDFWGFNFLQSYQWSEIQENYGQKLVFKSLQDENKIIGFFIAIEKSIWQKQKYWYIPRGPIFFDNQKINWLDFFLALKEESIDKNLKFVRLEPLDTNFLDYFNSNHDNLFKTTDVQPSKTSFLDLSSPEGDLLKKFAQKTRYNIKLAGSKGVEVFEIGPDGLPDFWKLISLTAGRDKFFIHSEKYYNHLVKYNPNFIKLFAARFEGKILAMGIFSFFASTASYLHGASSNEMRNLMAPYLLQWEVIKKSQSAGFKYYDFYGVDEKKWPGVSRFKNGFSGQQFSFPGTFDFVLDKNFYHGYNVIRKVKKFIKKYL